MDAQHELSLREELSGNPIPKRELEIREQLSPLNQTSQPADTTIGERIGERLGERQAETVKTFEDYSKGDITLPEAGLQVLGKAGAGAALDIVGEGVSTAATEGFELLPESTQQTAKDAWKGAMESDVGKMATQAINSGVEAWSGFKEENPRAAKDIESVVNIGAILMPAKAKSRAGPSPLGKASKYISDAASKQRFKRRADFVGDLISPKKTARVKVDETTRTTEKGAGPFKRSVVELSPREKQVAEEVYKIKGVSPKNSIQGNLNVISKHNKELAKKLNANIGNRRFLTLKSDAPKSIDAAVDKLIAENPVITGNAEIVARKVATKAKQIIESNASTPKGLLDSRKQLDQWIRKQKGNKVFDPELESSLSVSVREVRNSINDLVDESVGSVQVKNELKKQSLLFDAVENLAPKAADEYNSAISRSIENLSKILPFRDKFLRQAGTAFGLGYVAASEALAPVFATGLGVAAVGKGLYNVATSPKIKTGASSLIKGIDRALLSSKNPSMIKQLRADRAVLIELMKNAEEEPE